MKKLNKKKLYIVIPVLLLAVFVCCFGIINKLGQRLSVAQIAKLREQYPVCGLEVPPGLSMRSASLEEVKEVEETEEATEPATQEVTEDVTDIAEDPTLTVGTMATEPVDGDHIEGNPTNIWLILGICVLALMVVAMAVVLMIASNRKFMLTTQNAMWAGKSFPAKP